MKKRIVSFLLALVMAVSLLPVSAFAADGAYNVTEDATVQQGDDNMPVVQAAEDDVTTQEINLDSLIAGDSAGTLGAGKIYFVPVPNDVTTVSLTTSWDATQPVFGSCIAVGNYSWDSITKDDTEGYDAGCKFFNEHKNEISGINLSDESNYLFYGLSYFLGSWEEFNNSNYLLLEWGKRVTVDTSELENKLKNAPSIEKNNGEYIDTEYYHSGDKYNGKQTFTELKKTLQSDLSSRNINGFWDIYVDIYSVAKAALTSTNQERIDLATEKLSTAIANLIPADRANTTALYEALQSTPGSNDGAYSTKSWAAYKPVRDKAEALMATMFNAEGNPTDDNKAAANESIEKMAAELKAASKKLDAKGASTSQSIVKLQIEAIQYLAKKYDPDTLKGYTAESVAALRDAWTAALALAADTTVSDIGQNEAQAVTQALRKLRKAIYGLETDAQGEITVKVSVLDTNDVYRGRGTDSSDRNKNIYTGTLTLDANASAYDTLNSRGLLAGSRDFTAGDTLVFLNGEMLYDSGMDMYSDLAYTSGEYSAFQSTKLHDGDELTIVWMYPKQILNSRQVGTYSMALYSNPDWFRYSTISAPVEAEAGQPFTVSVTSDNALPFHNGSSRRAVAGAGIYRSEAAETADAAATGYVGVNTYAVTDATGKATVTLYNEGYTLLNAFRMDDEGRYTVGASVLVYVKPANDLSAVKKQLRSELDAVYGDENYPESYFTAANWQKVQEAYNAGVAGIDAAETTGDASIAQQTAVQTIKSLQKSADSFNTSNLASFRKSLNALPDDMTKLDQTAATQIAALKTYYDAMSPYQRSQLTGKEQQKYDAIMAANEKGLDEPHNYQLTFKQQFDSSVSAEDQAALKNMIAYLQEHTPTDDKYGDITGNKKLPQLFGFQYRRQQIDTAQALTYNISACVNPDYVAYLLCRDAAIKVGNRQGPGVISGQGWSISDATAGVSFVANDNVATMTGGMTYTINGKEYAIRSITVNGTDIPLSGTDNRTWQYKTATLIDATNYKGKTDVHINYKIRNALIDFHMPYGDVTITVTWAPVNADSSEAIAAAKTAAKADLAAELAKYKRSDKNYTNIENAYDDGVEAIDKASTLAEITKAKASALSNMKMAASGGYIGAAIKGWSQGDPFDAGDQVGTVTVSVEIGRAHV